MRKSLPFLLLFMSFQVFSSVKTFNMNDGAITLDVPSDWQEAERFMNVQHMILGPMEGTQRAVITLESTNSGNLQFDSKRLSTSEADYEKGRKEWMNKMGGKILGFSPYSYKDGRYSVGVSYEVDGHSYAENSHYMKCGTSLYQLKTLVPLEVKDKYENILNRVAESFHCEGEKQ